MRYFQSKRIRNKVKQWLKIPDKDVGYFGTSSKTDLPNLGAFCDVIPQLLAIALVNPHIIILLHRSSSSLNVLNGGAWIYAPPEAESAFR